MAQRLVSLLVQIVFSTNNRMALITPELEGQLYQYMSGTLRKMHWPCPKDWGHRKPPSPAGLFEDELRELLAKYRVAHGERYIWR